MAPYMDTDEELDIVEELRFFAEASETDGITMAMLSGCIFSDAADEIERLRALIATWADAQDKRVSGGGYNPRSIKWPEADTELRKAVGR
jgi:hypothetical protein